MQKITIPALKQLLADSSWSRKLLVISGIYILALLAVGILGGVTIFSQNKATQVTLRISRARVDAASKGQVAVLLMEKAQAELISAVDQQEKRKDAVLAIRASSALDESIQNLQQTLTGSAKVEELSRLLEKLAPAKMAVIKAARAGDDAAAHTQLLAMQADMQRVEDLSQELVVEEGSKSELAVAEQRTRALITVAVLGGLILCGIGLGLVASRFVAQLMFQPLAVLEQSVRSLSTGDLTIRVAECGQDEIGRTASAMGDMVQGLNSMVMNIHHSGESLNTQAQGVSSAAGELHDISGRLHDALEHIKDDAGTVLSTISTSLGQLHSAAECASHTSKLAVKNSREIKHTVDGFRQLQQQMESTAVASRDLVSQVRSINSFTKTIETISSQTHLLALNATIEAARAGEHGKGFAVVASEVRNLAKLTAAATSEISTLTQHIGSNIGSTVQMLEKTVEQAKTNIGDLLQVAGEIASSSEQTQQMQATVHDVVNLIHEQEQAVAGINNTVTGLCELSNGTRVQTEWMRGLSQELNVAATGLNSVVEKFRLQ